MLNGVTDEQLKESVQTANLGYFWIDVDYRLMDINDESLRMDGRSREELLGKDLWEVLPAGLDNPIAPLIKNVMNTRKTEVLRLHHMERETHDLMADISVRPWGEGVAVFLMDVSAMRRTELERQEYKRRYDLVNLATSDVFYDWDIVADISRINEPGAIELGIQPVLENPADYYRQNLHPEDRDRVMKALEETLKSPGGMMDIEYRIKHGDDYRNCRNRGFMVYDNDGKPVRMIGAISDFTEQRNAEERIRQLQLELLHLSRMSAMGTMASMMAHELNQPLGAIGTYLSGVETVLRKGDDPNVSLALTGLEKAYEASNRAGDIIRRLRMMLRKAEPIRMPVKVCKAVQDAVALSLLGRRHLEKNVVIEGDDDIHADADEVQIVQVFMNLIQNAVDAIEEGGGDQIRIVFSRASGAMIEICIEDNGPGISEEMTGRLFEFFATSKSGGMGIGLPITRTIVENHDGRISGGNKPDGGSLFKVLLPEARSMKRQQVQ